MTLINRHKHPAFPANGTVVPASTDFASKSAGVAVPKLWRPTVIPVGFGMTIDPREQRPFFMGAQPFPIKVVKLETGDYAITGHENQACVELKRLSDFDKFMGAERDTKTLPKLERMRDMLWSALVINCSPAKLYGERRHGRMTREHARGFLKKCRVQYGIHVFISQSREECERFILDHLTYVYTGLKK